MARASPWIPWQISPNGRVTEAITAIREGVRTEGSITEVTEDIGVIEEGKEEEGEEVIIAEEGAIEEGIESSRGEAGDPGVICTMEIARGAIIIAEEATNIVEEGEGITEDIAEEITGDIAANAPRPMVINA